MIHLKKVSALESLMRGGQLDHILKASPKKESVIPSSDSVEKKQFEPAYPILMQAKDQPIGCIQKKNRHLPVIQTIEQLEKIDLKGGKRFFLPPEIISVWSLHDRSIAGEPDISDIYESIRTEGQEEPCIVRLDDTSKTIELIAGFRRFFSVSNVSNMYLLADVYTKDEISDDIAWVEMTRENNLERKKPIPISVQVESDYRVLSKGLFRSLSELSKAAGKSDGWARQNRHLYESVPESIRNAAGARLMATLTAKNYLRLGQLFKSSLSNDWHTDIIDAILSKKTALFSANETIFPVKKIEAIYHAYGRKKAKPKTDHQPVTVETKNGINVISISHTLDTQELNHICHYIEQLLNKKKERVTE